MIGRVRNFSFAGLGISIEWYDFFLYVALNKFWLKIFFHGYPIVTAQLYILAIYCFSYFGRLIGGSVIASFTDRFGRKLMFIVSAMLMTGSSLCITLLPVQQLPQTVAIVLFAFLRFFQGVSVGGETPGGQTFLYEHASHQYKATALAFLNAFSTIGCIFALFIVYILTQLFTEQEIINYAWRIPYAIAAVSGVIVYYFRRNASETAAFKEIGRSKTRQPFLQVLRRYKSIIIFSILLCIVFDLISHFIDTGNILLIHLFHYKEAQLLRIAAISNVATLFESFLVALMIDHLKKYKVAILIGWLMLVLVVAPSFYALSTHSDMAYFSVYLLTDIPGNVLSFIVTIYIARLVPTSLRASALTLSYNVDRFSVSLLVFSLTAFLNHLHSGLILPKLIWGASILPLVCICYLFRAFKNDTSQCFKESPNLYLNDLRASEL